MPPIQEGTLPSVTNITPNSPPLPLFKAQVLSTWIMDGDKRSICTIAEPYGTYTPIDLTYPLITPPPLSSIHSWMARTCPHLNCQILLNPPQTTHLQITRAASTLNPPSLLNFQCPSKVQASVSSLVSALTFLDVYQTASNTSKARLLDNSTHQQGPSACMLEIRTIPLFEQGTDPISARAADLLACPPHLIEKNY